MDNPSQLRDTVDLLPMLQGPNGARFMYTMRLGMDLLLEKLNQGMHGHMPGRQISNDLLSYMGSDRLIVQGPSESPTSYGARLRMANQSWGRAGSRRAVLEQVASFLQTYAPSSTQLPVATIVNVLPLYSFPIAGIPEISSQWDTIYNTTPPGATPSTVWSISTFTFLWEAITSRWWNWLILFQHQTTTGNAGTSATIASAAGSAPGLGHNVNGVWCVDSTVTPVTRPTVTMTGLAGLTNADVGRWVTVSGAASAANNGTFPIQSALSTTSLMYSNPSAVAGDANNGAIHWSIGAYNTIGPLGVWGGATTPAFGAIGAAFGVSVSADLITSLRNVVRQWKKAESYYPNIIVAFDGGTGAPGDMFSPLSAAGSGNPNGQWGDVSKLLDGARVPARVCKSAFDAFCDGSGLYINCSVQNVA